MTQGFNRDVYFAKHIESAPDVKSYLEALSASPYRKHRRMAVLLLPELKRLLAEQQEKLEEIKSETLSITGRPLLAMED